MFFWLMAGMASVVYHRRQIALDRQHAEEQQALTTSTTQLQQEQTALSANTSRLLQSTQGLEEGNQKLITGTATLRGEVDRLERAVRTLPSDEFLRHFRSVHPEAHEVFAAQLLELQSLSAGDIAAAIRTLLKVTLLHAEHYDRNDEGMRYAANIMLHYSTTSLSADRFLELKAACPYKKLPFDRDETSGILELRKELSTFVVAGRRPMEERNSPVDEEVSRITLPIPVDAKTDDGRRYSVLPGAPLAFVLEDMDGYRDTETMADWCVQKGDFKPSLSAEVRDYFEPGSNANVRSLVSFALPVRRTAEGLIRPGVLNIHRDRVGMLEDKEVATHLKPLLTPLLLMLRDLCDLYGVYLATTSGLGARRFGLTSGG